MTKLTYITEPTLSITPSNEIISSDMFVEPIVTKKQFGGYLQINENVDETKTYTIEIRDGNKTYKRSGISGNDLINGVYLGGNND